jgi:hypothetical protein
MPLTTFGNHSIFLRTTLCAKKLFLTEIKFINCSRPLFLLYCEYIKEDCHLSGVGKRAAERSIEKINFLYN